MLLLRVSQHICFSLSYTGENAFYSWGEGRFGALGNGINDYTEEPKRITALDNLHVKSWFVGGWHNCVLTHEGDIYMYVVIDSCF
jgi:alpha-tubulin suppressor-like RCC1 family protein